MRVRPSPRILIACLAMWSAAVAAKPRFHFDLAPAPLTTSVARIGALAGVSIATSDPALLNGSGRAIRLNGTAEAALKALFKGTQARAVPIGSNGWRIVARVRTVERPIANKPETSRAPEIVVLGSKRDRPLADYPASITMIDGTELVRFGSAPDTNALARIDPTIQSTHLGPGRDKLFLRGIADSSFNGSGATLVGIYVNDLRLTYNAPDPALRFYDADRIEILEGPQGTLYGAGSMAGLVRITPHAPELNAASGEAWIGGTLTAYGAPGGDVGGIANIPLVRDRVALRVVGYAARDGGYIDDAMRGRDVNRTGTVGGRATLRVALGHEWTLDVGGIVQDIRNRDAQYAERDQPILTRASIAAQPSSNLFRAGDIVLTGSIGSVNVTSTTGVVDQSLSQSFLPDDGNVQAIYHQHDGIRLLTEEIRASSQQGATLGWVAGLSALDSRASQRRISVLDGFARSLGQAHNDLTDLTAFGELTIPLATTLSLTAGGRVSAVRLAGRAVGAQAKDEPLPMPPLFQGIRNEHFAVPSLAMGWSPRPAWLVFARYSQAYRPGGQTASGLIQRYDADRIRGLETGMRLMPGNGRMSGQVSGAVSRWSDIQADVLGANGLPITQNIGDGSVRSIAGSIDWRPTLSLRIKLAGMLARGHVDGPGAQSGAVIRTPLPNVARDTLAGSIDWRHDIDERHALSTNLSINHVGRSVLGSGSELSRIEQGGYWLASGGLGLATGGRTISLDIDNLLDSHADSFAFGTPTFRYDDQQETPLRPRTIRIGLRHRF